MPTRPPKLRAELLLRGTTLKNSVPQERRHGLLLSLLLAAGGPGGLQEGHPHGDTLQPPTHAASPPATPCQRKTRGRRRDIRTKRTLTPGLKAEIHLGLGCPHPPRRMQKDTELPHEGGIMDISIM